METDWVDCPLVETISGKVGGLPLIKGTRVAADTVVEAAELGELPDEIAFNYDLNVEVVYRLMAYAENHRTSLAS